MATKITELLLVNTRTFVLRSHGPTVWDDILHNLDEGTRWHFERGPDPSGWVSFGVVMDLFGTICEAVGGDSHALLHELGHYNAEANLATTQKILMKLLTIKMVLKIAGVLWTGRVRDGGKMAIHDRGARAVGCTIERPPEVSELWWRYLAGWFQRTIELAGGEDVQSEWTGGGGEPFEPSTFEVRWR